MTEGNRLQARLDALTPERRAKIEEGAQELIAAHMSLQEIRKSRRITQDQVAAFMKIRQSSVSKFEGREDMHLSSLKEFIEACGGEMVIQAKFEDSCIAIEI